jgi:hypothetical protein
VGGDRVSRRWSRGTADEDDVEDENGRFGLEKAEREEREGLKQKAIAIVVDLRSLSLSLSLPAS